jgi:hypothetical protein
MTMRASRAHPAPRQLPLADARLDVHSPRVQGAVSPEFLAQGFDAVLVAGSGEDGCGLDWLAMWRAALDLRRSFS